MNPVSLIFSFIRQLKYRNQFLLAAGLFLLNLIIPDFIPFIDEILLGLLTLILSRWKQTPEIEDDNIIEGEVIKENDPK